MIFSYNWLNSYIKGKPLLPVKAAEILNLHSFETEAETFSFSLTVQAAHAKEIRFVTTSESDDIKFELFRNGKPAGSGIFIGPRFDSVAGPEVTLNINDERFGLGRANVRPKKHDGIFIWAIPTHFRKQAEPDLTAEMVEQLRSIGYLN